VIDILSARVNYFFHFSLLVYSRETKFVSFPMMTSQLHSSVIYQLHTEISSLDALIHRSKDQHRSQLFLQRARGVYRLGLLVHKALGRDDSDSADAGRNTKRLSKVVVKVYEFNRTAANDPIARSVADRCVQLDRPNHRASLLPPSSRSSPQHIRSTVHSSLEPGRMPSTRYPRRCSGSQCGQFPESTFA